MEFRVLGPLEARVDGRALPLGEPLQQVLLGLLLLEPDRVVPLDRLVDALWGARPPATAAKQVRNRAAALRRLFRTAGHAQDVVVTHPAGYRLAVGDGVVDTQLFEERVRQAKAAGRTERARHLFDAALALWRGTPFGGLPSAVLARAAVTWEERRLSVLEDYHELRLDLGGHREQVGELATLAAAYPLRERFRALLMLALYRCGRQAEALDAYHEIRQLLDAELGLAPGPELAQLQQRILRADPALDIGLEPANPPTPAELPADVPSFAGRAAELAWLDELLPLPSTVAIAVISGTAGVGKSALAVHWAHRVKDRFPDGQLYINLQGFDPTGPALHPAKVVRGFLDAFAVPPWRVPVDPAAQAALYRSMLAGRRVLILLDNARDVDQVRPLLPGAPGCLVLVTSRNQLSGLVSLAGARPLMLDLLPEAEAYRLLAGRLGDGRLAAEPQPAAELVSRCARLPLALAIVAARAVSHSEFSLAALAGELRDAQGGLDALDGGDPATDLRSVFSWSYHTLKPPAARLFRLLGLYPGPTISVPAAASLAGWPVDQVRPLLAELARSHLVAEPAAGRFAFHDLLRAYAQELAEAIDDEAERRAALHRILDHYLHTAYAAARLLHPQRESIDLDPPQPGTASPSLASDAEALSWLTAEHPVLLAAATQAGAAGFDRHAWQLAWSLVTYFNRRGHWHDWATTQRAALAATERLADPAGQAHAHRFLACAYAGLGRYDDARDHYEQALAGYGALADQTGEAHTHLDLGGMLLRQDRSVEALQHAQRALDLYRATGHRPWQARALNAVGWCHAVLANHRPAIAYCMQALELLRELGDRYGEAATWDSLGFAHHQLGEHQRAVNCYQQALELRRDIGDRHHEAETLAHLGDAHHAVGDSAAAQDAWTHALAILDQLDHPDADRMRAKLTVRPARQAPPHPAAIDPTLVDQGPSERHTDKHAHQLPDQQHVADQSSSTPASVIPPRHENDPRVSRPEQHASLRRPDAQTT